MSTPIKPNAEIATDPVFVAAVEKHLEHMLSVRSKRPPAKPGMRYIRDWYDRMTPEQKKASYFCSEIQLIWVKKSQLSTEIRSIIHFVCTHALIDYMKHEKQQPQTQPKPKATRSKKLSKTKAAAEIIAPYKS